MKILIPIVPLILGVVSCGTYGRVRVGMLMDDERRNGCEFLFILRFYFYCLVLYKVHAKE